MSQSTPSTSSHADLIKKYFDAWQSHSVPTLGEIFHQSATYTVRGKPPISGLQDIEQYWRRNSARQLSLRVRHIQIPNAEDVNEAVFLSTFDDTEEHKRQAVGGTIVFSFDPESGKILSLVETYIIAPVQFEYRTFISRYFVTKLSAGVRRRANDVLRGVRSLRHAIWTIYLFSIYGLLLLTLLLASALYFHIS